MSAPYSVTTPDRNYLVVDDLRITNRVLMFGLVRDDATLAEAAATVRVRASRPDLRARAAGGYYSISGRPDVSFAAPASLPATFDVTVSAPGFREQTFSVTIPGPPYPVAGPAVDLRRLPTTIQGRVTDVSAPAVPQPGATVASDVAGIVVTRTALRFDHAAGVTVRRRTPSAMGAAETLVDAVLPGQRTLPLTGVAGMVADGLVRIGTEAAGEFGIIDSVDAAGTAIVLTGGLTRGFTAGAAVQRMNRGPSTANRLLTAPAFAGEATLRLSGALPGTVLQIDDTGREEFHAHGAVADGDGFFVLAGVTGVRTLDLVANAAGLSPVTIKVALDYARPFQQVDFRLAP